MHRRSANLLLLVIGVAFGIGASMLLTGHSGGGEKQVVRNPSAAPAPRAEQQPLAGASRHSGSGRMPIDPALHGAEVPRSANNFTLVGDAIFPDDYTGLKDERVLQTYQGYVTALDYALTKDVRPDGTYSEATKRKIGIFRALTTLIQQQRFCYLGEPAKRPTHTHTDRVRYMSTTMGGLCMVFEVSRDEFPDAFIEGTAPTRNAKLEFR